MLTHKKNLLSLTIATLILLSIPSIALLTNWQWTPHLETPSYLYILYLWTETGSYPYAIITCAIFALILILLLKLPIKQSLVLILILATAISIGQIAKSTLKSISQEPRPYVVWLEQSNLISQEDFYQLNRQERANFVAQQHFSSQAIPNWLQNHWENETGYAFPSGHTIFAAQWALMALLLLLRKKAYVAISLFLLWALVIESSRLLLGMHWPQDLIVSCLFAFVISYLAHLSWEHWVFRPKPLP